jgi:hypothetical protein
MAFEKSSAGNVASGGVVGADGQYSEPGLADDWFPGHTEKDSTEWMSLKGKMLSPYELDGIESTSETGASRAHSPSPNSVAPTSTIIVQTPLTMGGGTFAK